ncbi:MAG: hypothetical protein COA69_01720 [Robiginitomaculum sp.]|nr:MAG: hypothetical protein COA69_01720 [Robiginitomaculum sp.]
MGQLSPKDTKLLARIAHKHAIIVHDEGGRDMFIALPYGDRRRRPIAWIDHNMLNRMLASGALEQQDKKHSKVFILAPSYKNRISGIPHNEAKNSFANQHRDVQTRDVYTPDGVRRSARVNSASIFRRLARHVDRSGRPFLLADEVEAGERFARDYACSMTGSVSTQNMASTGGMGGTHDNVAENMSVMALDAKRRVREALEMLGPGMDRTLIALCGREWGLEQIEAAEGWPKRSAKTVLKLALVRLSAYYGCKPGIAAQRSKSARASC